MRGRLLLAACMQDGIVIGLINLVINRPGSVAVVCVCITCTVK